MSKYTRPGQKIQLKNVNELLGVVNEESAMDIEIEKISPFKDHPFKVTDDEKMQDLGEIRDTVLTALCEFLNSSEKATRRADVISDILDNNEYQHLSEERKQRMKALFIRIQESHRSHEAGASEHGI
jgi:hypothetical protein